MSVPSAGRRLRAEFSGERVVFVLRQARDQQRVDRVQHQGCAELIVGQSAGSNEVPWGASPEGRTASLTGTIVRLASRFSLR